MENIKKVHFIAIGGSIMHNLAVNLAEDGYQVTGSDDTFFEPSRSTLQSKGLLPEKEGWNPEKITNDLSAVILGMHAKKDNPELLRAQELNIPIYSFPEYIYERSKNKQRIVIAGSHGKTTITSMIMHVLNKLGKPFDYLVGAKVEGFETMVKLSNAPIIIIEGDEYSTSALDKTPKFLHYNHHIALISGIDWDHVNIYPDRDQYVVQFDKLADHTPKAGSLVFNEDDNLVSVIGNKEREDVVREPYSLPDHFVKDGKTYLKTEFGDIQLNVFGEHNLLNIEGARKVLSRISVQDKEFYDAIGSFKGASKRMELVGYSPNGAVYKDYAHAPSKIAATTIALKNQYPDRKLIACMELHTYSSLTKDFLSEYEGKLSPADEKIVFFNPKAIEIKGLDDLNPEDVKSAFGDNDIKVFNNSEELRKYLEGLDLSNANLLMMSSGNFDGINIDNLSEKLL
ncbi:UDP-N-acetylmuramate--L-alanine ligase [Marinigracilibium pacificum]|uniref:Peptidoglycan synthetase n=1 Tax=Marinigracilibium pacificum TaxID=2729599 RepID=A0A848IXQ7_9BACT|nr:Mur ligase family protein [Marinigracilibium pacificum]NMM48101.1 peptidoglycan synthetase [Marinigracilibium pacificum]